MNAQTHHDPISLRRYDEAAEWVLRLSGTDASDDEVNGWLRWCEEDPKNLAAFEQLQQDWQDTEGFKHAPELLGRPGEATPVLRPSARAERTPLPSWRPRFRDCAIAAGLVAVATFSYLFMRPSTPVPAFVTASNLAPATLPDGSSLQLSAKATAEVDFTGTDRHVALRPGGEAYIKVHHDTARPFIVRAGTVTVTAVGTAFDVRRDSDRVTVTVEEGAIVVSGPGPSGPTEWRAGAGYQVEYSEGARTAVVSRVDTQSVLRWRDGELAYDSEPLESVIADINRYSTFTVVIRDPVLGRLPFTGTVFVASIDDWLKALAAKYPVRARASSGGAIELQSTAHVEARAH